MLYIKRNICMVKEIFNLRPHLLKSIVHVIWFIMGSWPSMDLDAYIIEELYKCI